MSVYVEILIRASMDALWRHTQEPDLHERWDLRFSEIDYLPRATDEEPQRFRYATRLGFGRAIEGDGESVGTRDLADGSRTSALRFGSADRLSLIREGRGYWKYEPTPDGVRFLTSYDYTTRFGRLGRIVDGLLFRPLIGWATAWSFDRLRLWLERGIGPEVSARQTLIHGIARVGLATIVAYHGVVPKLLGPDPDEIALVVAGGIPPGAAGTAVAVIGIGEVLFALGLLVLWHRAWPPRLLAVAAVVLTAGIAAVAPGYLGRAFNPLTLNLAVLCLAAIDLATLSGLPSAANCRRRP